MYSQISVPLYANYEHTDCYSNITKHKGKPDSTELERKNLADSNNCI